MVGRFNRSFSLPRSPRPIKTPPPTQTPPSGHVRSVSLPCRSHPLISQIHDQIRSIKDWLHEPEPTPTTSAPWICTGLARLHLLHSSLNHLINLPHNQDAIRRGHGSQPNDQILDAFLRLADAHGCFRSEMAALNQVLSEAQIAVRRNDSTKLVTSFVKPFKKMERRLVGLASSLREALSRSTLSVNDKAELTGVIAEVISVTVSASAAVFLGVAAITSTVADLRAAKNVSWMAMLRLSPSRSSTGDDGEKCGRRNVMERLEEMEERIGGIEGSSNMLYRCFVNTRVSLLNISTL